MSATDPGGDDCALGELRAYLRASIEDLFVLIRCCIATRDEVMALVAETEARCARHEGAPQ